MNTPTNPETAGGAEADRVFAEHEAQFGAGHSSGVSAIMLHTSLPATFGPKNWADWFFKPAPAAFEWARTRGLIKPSGLTKWAFTPLGLEVARRFQDSEQSL